MLDGRRTLQFGDVCPWPFEDPGKWDFRILATDISTRVLQVGINGVYPKVKVEKVPKGSS